MPLIETQHARVPWRWVILLQVLTQARILVFFASVSLTFTLRKVVESPLVINSISSLDVVFNLLVAAPCLYYSDRIWTRFGRRLPFALGAFAIMAVILIVLPLVEQAVPMIVLVVLWLVFWDVGTTFETLVMEIIPAGQRGRAAAIGAWLFNANIILSTVVINGRFDDVVRGGAFTLRGEELIYWWAAACLVFLTLFLACFVRERRPVEPTPPGAGWRGAVHDVFRDRRLWPVYLLAMAGILIQASLGAIEPLLLTEQWGYSKQDLGTNIFAGGIINLALVIPLVGLLADRIDRLRMFAFGAVGMGAAQIAYFCFVQFVLPDRRPSIGHLIFFGQLYSIFGQFVGVALQPLLFDYIPRDCMGAAQAGLNFVRSIARLLTLNGVGIWVTLYSGWFLPAGQYDYFSGYLFMVGLNFLGLAAIGYFAWCVRTGRAVPHGRIVPPTALN